MRELIRFQIKPHLDLNPFNYVIYRLIKNLPNLVDTASSVLDSYLYEFQDIVVSRKVLGDEWKTKYSDADSIKTKLKEIVSSTLLPVNNELYLLSQLGQEEPHILTISAASLLLLFNPYHERNVYDISSWQIRGAIETQKVYEIGPLLLELACHAQLTKDLDKVAAFEYYARMLKALKAAMSLETWRGNEAFISWSTFSLVSLALKFRDNLAGIFDYPYLAEYVHTVASEILGFKPEMTESALSSIFIEAVNNIPNTTLAITTLLSTNFSLLTNVFQGNVMPYIPEVEDASYLIDESGRVYKKEDFAPANHEHSEYLKKDEPAQNANYLVDSYGNLYSLDYFARVKHTHSEYVNPDELKDADYLWTPERLYTAEDFAERSHTHENYLTVGQPARAARKFLAELISGRRLSPVMHEHPELLKPDEVADSTYRLGGKTGSEFAPANHEHPQFITKTYAAAIGELKSQPNDDAKGAKGVYAIFDEAGTDRDEVKAVHFLFGQTVFTGASNIIYVPNVVYAHCTLVGPSTQTALPVVNYIYDTQQPNRIIGVQFVSTSNALTQIMYMIAYQPDVTEWFKRNMLPSDAKYDVV
ncbi:MAG: hypothetical protein QXE80_03425 [Pyrobaculum sp.]